MIAKIIYSTVAVLCCTVCAGCFNLKQPAIEKQHFVISGSFPQSPSMATNVPGIKVRSFSIAPEFVQKDFAYKTSQDVFTSDFYNVFFVSPADQITQRIINELSTPDSGYNRISTEGTIPETDYLLQGHIHELFADYTTDSPAAVVKISFTLIDLSNNATNVVFEKTYTEHIPLADKTPNTLVNGWEQALSNISDNLKPQMLEAFSSYTQKHPQPQTDTDGSPKPPMHP